MRLKTLKLRNFRIHTEATFSFEAGLNVITGPNGTGKTNVLEAVHYLCLTRSFLVSSDSYVLQKGSPFFDVDGEFEDEKGRDIRVRIAFQPGESKRIFVGGARIERPADFIGTIPVVAFSPDDYAITAAGPEHRRRFIDSLICQADRTYLENLIRYRRILKQRNDILQRMRKSSYVAEPELIESWTAELVQTGARLYRARYQFIDRFRSFLEGAYRALSAQVEEPVLVYRPLRGIDAKNELGSVETAFREVLAASAREERSRGITMRGPHRDDITFKLGELPLRRYGSQGQHRSFVLALKFAQHAYLSDETGRVPLMLLDDVFDNLDRNRIQVFLDVLSSSETGQSLVTAARRDIFKDARSRDYHYIAINDPVSADQEAADVTQN